MAEGSDYNPRRVFQCPSCTVSYNSVKKPIRLTCTHDLCSVCLDDLLERDESSRTISCPRCNKSLNKVVVRACPVNSVVLDIVMKTGSAGKDRPTGDLDYLQVIDNDLSSTIDLKELKSVIGATVTAKKSAAEDETELEERIIRLKEKQEECEKQIRKLVDDSIRFKAQTKDSRAFIIKQAEDAITVVKTQRDIKLKTIDGEAQLIENKIAALKKELELHVSQLKKYMEDSAAALASKNARQVLSKLQEGSYNQLLESNNSMKMAGLVAYNLSFFNNKIDAFDNISRLLVGRGVLVEKVDQFGLDFEPAGIALQDNRCVVVSSLKNLAAIFTRDGNKLADIKLNDDVKTFDVYTDGKQNLIVDTSNGKLHLLDMRGKYISSLYFSVSLYPRSIRKHGQQLFISCEKTKQLYVANADNLQGECIYLEKFEQKGESPVQFAVPAFLAVNDQLLVVSDHIAHQVHAFKFDGQHVFAYGTGQPGADDGQLYHPWGVCCHDDHIIIADCANSRLVVLSDQGKLLGYIKCQGMVSPRSVAVGEDGLLRVAHGLHQAPWFVSTLRYKII